MATAFWLLVTLACIGNVIAGVPLTLLETGTRGKCLDGSPGGFYFDKATTSKSSTKWIFDLQGGGECVTAKSCSERLSISLGSSKYFKKHTELKFLSSNDQVENPYGHTWNRVFIPYCSQDLWSGTRIQNSSDSFGLYFSGHIIVQEVFKALLANTGLAQATQVVVTGESAGGIGSWINVGWVKEQLPKARTVVVPVAGFYAYSYPYQGPDAAPAGLADFSASAWSDHYELWQSHVDSDCKKAFPQSPWVCMLSNNSRPFIDVPAFVVEAQTDKVQLEEHDNIPAPPWSNLSSTAQHGINSYIQRWKQNMTKNIHLHLHPSDGLFFPACYVHTDFSKEGPFITEPMSGKEYTYAGAFGHWHAELESQKAMTGFRLEDSCGLFCGKCPDGSVPGSWLKEESAIAIMV